VRQDELLGDLFANMPDEHPRHVAIWFAEVFGGPNAYTEEHGGYSHMVSKHLGLAISERQRARWVQLIGLAADDVGLPSDPEFRSGIHGLRGVGHAPRARQLPAGSPSARRGPVPRWGWGEAPPYRP
jgi:hemoglobin